MITLSLVPFFARGRRCQDYGTLLNGCDRLKLCTVSCQIAWRCRLISAYRPIWENSIDIIKVRIDFHDRSTITTFIASDGPITDNGRTWLHGIPGVIDVRHKIHTRNANTEQLRKIKRLEELQAWLISIRPSVVICREPVPTH